MIKLAEVVQEEPLINVEQLYENISITETAGNTDIFSIPEPLSLARITTMERVVAMIIVTSELLIKKEIFFSNLSLKNSRNFGKRCEEVGGLIPRELFMVDTTVGLAECLGSQ